MRRTVAWRTSGRIVALSGFIFLMSGLFSWGVNTIFTIRNVEVSGEAVNIVIDPVKLPRNLLFFPVDSVTEQILKAYPLVKSVTLKKRYPSTLIVIITPRKPFAIVGVEKEIYALDADGVVLGKYPNNTDLPTITIALSPMQPGDRVADRAVTAAIGFLRETASMTSVSDIVIHDASSLRAYADTMSIVFPQHADMRTLARTLQTMISGFRIKGTLPKTIDFRFDKPVITN